MKPVEAVAWCCVIVGSLSVATQVVGLVARVRDDRRVRRVMRDRGLVPDREDAK